MPLHPLQAEWDLDVRGGNPLDFPGYDPPAEESVRTGLAVVGAGEGRVTYALIESRFEIAGGSMGAGAGEKVVRAYRRAVDEHLPVVVVASSGGARMQEGMIALVQLARTSRAASTHSRAGLLSIGVFRGAVTGGVLASYASLVDVRAAERATTVGFAGPRVVELTTGEPLPRGSHTAESAYDHGLVDAVLPAGELATWVEGALGATPRPPARPPQRPSPRAGGDFPPDPPGSRGQFGSAWAEVLRARAPGRPTGIDRAAAMCASWTELRGADRVVRAGLATIAGRRAVVVATDRYERDGRPGPAGYRLAQRAIALAGRLTLPLVTFVDTPGADPRAPAEAAGIAVEIARTLAAMADVPTPTVSVCVGEGGSGGALALAATDLLLIQEHAVFSVIGPEGAAAILDRDVSRAPERAEHLRLTAHDLVALGVADGIAGESDAALQRAVVRALSTARVGERSRRFDAATARWVR